MFQSPVLHSLFAAFSPPSLLTGSLETHLIQIDAGHYAGMFTPQARSAGVHHTIIPNSATHDQEGVTIDCRELGVALDAVLAGQRYKSPDPYEDKMLQQKWPVLFENPKEW